MTTTWLRRSGRFAAVLIVAWLLSMTLRPGQGLGRVHLTPFTEKSLALACLLADCPGARRSFDFLFVDLLGNVAVFVPVGAALTLATLPQPRTGRRTWRQKLHRWLGIALGATLLSLAIEVAQLRVPGRSTDVDDLILNSLGAILGAALMQLLILAVKRRSHD